MTHNHQLKKNKKTFNTLLGFALVWEVKETKKKSLAYQDMCYPSLLFLLINTNFQFLILWGFLVFMNGKQECLVSRLRSSE